MKVCDVVCNSIWYDPRVRKQIVEYKNNNVEVCAVGLKCNRYNYEKISEIPCKTIVVCIDNKYDGKQRSLFGKLWREHLRNKGIKNAVLEEKPDVIHANDLDALIAVYPAYKKLKCKLVYDSHEICTENLEVTKKYRFILPLVKLYERHMIKHIQQMVCVSHAAANYFVAEYGIAKPMVVTNCALKREMVAEPAGKHTGFEVLNHGQFYTGRGYEQMIGAAKLLDNFDDVKICVRGFGRLEESMRKTVAEDHLKNFVFYPPVNVERLIPEAAASHVGIAFTEPICLNFKLSVSNKLFEYAAAGLPVIMSDIPEHRYLNEKYHFGIILEENTPEALKNAILRLYQDKDCYETCRKNAIFMSEELNWENEFAKLIAFESALIGG